MFERWYQDALIYCLDVETYADSDGDGVGDFVGLTERLSHIAGMGFNCIWLLPFYPTPNRDNGYDISDYYGVDPRLGTLGDFVEFCRQAHTQGIRVVIDLVVNHTSAEHPWFQQAREDPDSPYRDFYVWSKHRPDDMKEGMVFPGKQESVWTYDRKAKAYYYHRFFPHQPDLNIANPRVREEIAKVMGFWLQLGVNGFRIDAAPFVIELQNVDVSETRDPFGYIDEMHNFLSWRNGDAMLLAEANVDTDEIMDYFGDGHRMQMLFNFLFNQHLYLALARQEAEPLTRALRMLPSIPESCQWAYFARNHDELALERLSTYERDEVSKAFGFTDDMFLYNRGVPRRLPAILGGDQRRIAQVYSLILSMSGTPVIWYGEELGMGDYLELPERDPVRTPMQWSSEANAGFSTAPPERLVRPVVAKGPFSYKRVNVVDQRREPGSLLNTFEMMLRVRRTCPEFGRGQMQILATNHNAVLAMRHDYRGQSVVALHNLSDAPCEAEVDFGEGAKALTDLLDGMTHVPLKGGTVQRIPIEAYGCRWLRLNREA